MPAFARHAARFSGADFVDGLVHFGDDVEAVENMQGFGAFLASDFQMASLPFESEWRGANNAEESGRTPVFAGARRRLPRDN